MAPSPSLIFLNLKTYVPSNLSKYIFPTPIFAKIANEILDYIEKYNVVIEININGFSRRKSRNGKTYIDYPCDYFWDEVAKRNIRIVYGGDFHNPDSIDDKNLNKQLEDFINRHNLKLVDINDVYDEYKQRLKDKKLTK